MWYAKVVYELHRFCSGQLLEVHRKREARLQVMITYDMGFGKERRISSEQKGQNVAKNDEAQSDQGDAPSLEDEGGSVVEDEAKGTGPSPQGMAEGPPTKKRAQSPSLLGPEMQKVLGRKANTVLKDSSMTIQCSKVGRVCVLTLTWC